MSDESTCDKSSDAPNFWHAKYTELCERGDFYMRVTRLKLI